ncbi:hypothetical protein DES53_1212 [Roseimicrobium gellanilyticum]|uniref:Leucine rich repeat (LRR) protein n=1 Tax=Roseimicrobium gellanilyticum TaxID=748857 RepID=A0A366H3T5_9BACT|nr:hypothetical protein [Roseimicrobium gellanilyticum]RBP35482.1 hypothetical protein DES53_1212 [Roseimicrobium gellanilyticum]
MKPPTRILLSLVGVAVLAYVIERLPARRSFAQLRQHAQIYDWSTPEWVPEKYAPLLPFAFPQTIALQSKPSDPKAFTSALRRLRKVTTIWLYSEDVGMEVYEALGFIRGVRALKLHNLPSDAAFQCFTQFESVEHLTLFEAHVTDDSLPHLEKFQKVTELEVCLTKISTSVAESALKLPRLADFRYAHSSGQHFKFSTQPEAMLRAARPGLAISWE